MGRILRAFQPCCEETPKTCRWVFGRFPQLVRLRGVTGYRPLGSAGNRGRGDPPSIRDASNRSGGRARSTRSSSAEKASNSTRPGPPPQGWTPGIRNIRRKSSTCARQRGGIAIEIESPHVYVGADGGVGEVPQILIGDLEVAEFRNQTPRPNRSEIPPGPFRFCSRQIRIAVNDVATRICRRCHEAVDRMNLRRRQTILAQRPGRTCRHRRRPRATPRIGDEPFVNALPAAMLEHGSMDDIHSRGHQDRSTCGALKKLAGR